MEVQEEATAAAACQCPGGSTHHHHHHHHEASAHPSNVREITSLSQTTKEHMWYKLHSPPPLDEKMTERVGHSLVFSQTNKSMYMIGGGNRTGDCKEIWTFPIPTAATPFGGSLHEKLSEEFTGLYEFGCAKQSSTGSGDENMNMNVNNEERQEGETIWIFCGANSVENSNDVHTLDLQTETLTTCYNGKQNGPGSDVPAPRTQGNNSCFVHVRGEDYLAVFGGGVRGEAAISDVELYLFAIKEKTWKKVDIIGMKPDPVQGHAMAAIGTKVFLHGGMDRFVFSSDLYVIDLHFEQPVWLKLTPPGPGPSPCPRAAHGMIAYNNCLYVVAGVGDEGALMDVWKFDAESFEWHCLQSQGPDTPATAIATTTPPSPSPRTDFAITLVKLDGDAPTTTATAAATGGSGRVEHNMLLIHGGMNTLGILFKDFWVFPLL